MDPLDRPRPRRDFLSLACWGMGLTAVGYGTWTILGAAGSAIDPTSETLRVDLSLITQGEHRSFVFADRPVMVVHRTPQQVAAAQAVAVEGLRDPLANNANREPSALALDINRGEGDFIAVWAACTRDGCVPRVEEGAYGGWLCPCCASHYDGAGRVRKGPAPRNLAIPRYTLAGEIMTVYRDGAGPMLEDEVERLLRR